MNGALCRRVCRADACVSHYRLGGCSYSADEELAAAASLQLW